MSRKVVAVLFVTGLLIAQSASQRSSASGARSHRPSIPGGVRSMKGCLVKEGEQGFALISQRGSRVPVSSAEDLSSHLGQLVKASGAFVDKDKDEAQDPSSSNQPQSKLHPDHEFRVIKIDVLSQTCSPGKKK